MDDARIGHQGGGKYPVRVRGFGRHQAVGGKQHRCRDVGKFSLLILPRRAEIALEMGIFFQFRIAVGRQHFAMGVDVDAFALGLLQQQLQVVEVVACDDDERSLLHRQRDSGRRRRTVAFGVGLIQQRHTLEVFLAHLHDDGQQRIHAPVLTHSKECLGEKAVHFLVGIAQYHGVMGIRRHTTHTEKDERFEAANILLRVPEQIHIIIIIPPTARAAARAVWCQSFPFRVHLFDQLANGLFVEVHISDGGEQSLDHQPPCIGIDRCIGVRGSCQPNERARQLVLKFRYIGGLAADTGLTGTAGTTRCLLALKAKHFMIHYRFPPISVQIMSFYQKLTPRRRTPCPHCTGGTQNPPTPHSKAFRGRCRPLDNLRSRHIINRKDCIYTSLCFFLPFSNDFVILPPAGRPLLR